MQDLRTGDRAFIRELNTSIVLDCIRQHEPVSRAQIARITGLGRSTVSGIVATLQESGLVTSAGTAPSTGGRKPDLLALAQDAFYALGMKIEPSHVRAALTDLRGSVVAETATPLHGKESSHVLAALHTAYTQLTRGRPPSSLLGVGIALPGLVDSAAGLSIDPHFFHWRHLPLRDRTEEMWSLPVWIENDARAGALGEKWASSSPEALSFLFVTVGIGIGAGIVLKGELMEGGLVGAGHLGHTTMVMGGHPCHCGLQGCLETVANDAALLRAANSRSDTRYESVAQVFEAARSGNKAAVSAVREVISYLALGIANVVKVTGISRVILGGESAVAGGPFLVDSLRTALQDLVFAETRSQVEVEPSRLGNAVWQVGAAALVLESLYMPPIYAASNRILERVIQHETS